MVVGATVPAIDLMAPARVVRTGSLTIERSLIEVAVKLSDDPEEAVSIPWKFIVSPTEMLVIVLPEVLLPFIFVSALALIVQFKVAEPKVLEAVTVFPDTAVTLAPTTLTFPLAERLTLEATLTFTWSGLPVNLSIRSSNLFSTFSILFSIFSSAFTLPLNQAFRSKAAFATPLERAKPVKTSIDTRTYVILFVFI